MNFFPEIPLTTGQAEAMARALFHIAQSDGLHEREAALVASFWAEAGGSMDALSDLAQLVLSDSRVPWRKLPALHCLIKLKEDLDTLDRLSPQP